MKKSFVLSLIITLLFTSGASSQNQPKKTTGYSPVNGLKMYYEIHGEGQPLILLHGAYMTIDMNWAEYFPELSKGRKVIALELQGHGHTADIDRPFNYQALATDVALFMKHLKIDSADVMGYSFGGTIAIQLAIQNPELVKKLIIVSTVYKYEGWLPELRQLFANFQPSFFDNTPLKPAYESVAPDPKHWTKFVNKMIELDKKDFNLGEDKVKAIKSPTLLLMGDNDGVDMKHKAEFYSLLGGNISGDLAGLPKSQLAIVPGTTHVSLMMESKKVLAILKPFLGIGQ